MWKNLFGSVFKHRDVKPSAAIAEDSSVNNVGFSGNYGSWEEALAHSAGYDSDIILQKTRQAMLKVKKGEAVYERDSVVSDKMEYPFPVLASLLRAAIENGGNLSVLDFGGALGSSYFQCRNFLGGLSKLRWNVVEQPKHVACGRAEFQDGELRFYHSIDECLNHEQPDVLLLSGVLPYLKDPYTILKNMIGRGFPYIVLDRTLFIRGDSDVLTIETVPPWIYSASYPTRIFSEQKLLFVFNGSYDLITDFVGFESGMYHLGEAEILYKGFIFRLNSDVPPKRTHTDQIA